MRHRLITERNRRFNSDRQLEVTERGTQYKLICFTCRHQPNTLALLNAWEKAHPPPWLGKRPRWPGLNGKCPECGGRLIEIAW